MHKRSLVDGAFRAAGATVVPAMETDSVLTLALSVVAGNVCSVLPGALVDAVRGHDGLEALPLTAPVLTTPIGFMSHRQVQPAPSMQRWHWRRTPTGCSTPQHTAGFWSPIEH